MKITMRHLKSRWNPERLERIKRCGLTIGSGSLLKAGTRLKEIDAVWGRNHDGLVNRRNATKGANHIFVSEMCDVAVEEYATVCRLLGIDRIHVMGLSLGFVERSETLLGKISGIKISTHWSRS